MQPQQIEFLGIINKNKFRHMTTTKTILGTLSIKIYLQHKVNTNKKGHIEHSKTTHIIISDNNTTLHHT